MGHVWGVEAARTLGKGPWEHVVDMVSEVEDVEDAHKTQRLYES